MDTKALVTIPLAHLRRLPGSAALEDAWPGCAKPPSACEPHHLTPRAEGGRTEIRNLKMLCWFQHHVCVHRDRWQVTVHADGTVTARAPWGIELPGGQPLTRTA